MAANIVFPTLVILLIPISASWSFAARYVIMIIGVLSSTLMARSIHLDAFTDWSALAAEVATSFSHAPSWTGRRLSLRRSLSCEGICCTSMLSLKIGYSKILYTQRRHNTGLTPMAVASRLCLDFWFFS